MLVPSCWEVQNIEIVLIIFLEKVSEAMGDNTLGGASHQQSALARNSGARVSGKPVVETREPGCLVQP